MPGPAFDFTFTLFEFSVNYIFIYICYIYERVLQRMYRNRIKGDVYFDVKNWKTCIHKIYYLFVWKNIRETEGEKEREIHSAEAHSPATAVLCGFQCVCFLFRGCSRYAETQISFGNPCRDNILSHQVRCMNHDTTQVFVTLPSYIWVLYLITWKYLKAVFLAFNCPICFKELSKGKKIVYYMYLDFYHSEPFHFWT